MLFPKNLLGSMHNCPRCFKNPWDGLIDKLLFCPTTWPAVPELGTALFGLQPEDLPPHRGWLRAALGLTLISLYFLVKRNLWSLGPITPCTSLTNNPEEFPFLIRSFDLKQHFCHSPGSSSVTSTAAATDCEARGAVWFLS